MRQFISTVVTALANFIEFDQAADLGHRRGMLPGDKIFLADDQRDVLWQRLARAGADVTRMRDLPWADAEAEIARRQRDSRQMTAYRIAQREANQEINAAMGLGA